MAEVEGEIKEKKKNALKVIGLVKGDHFGGGGRGKKEEEKWSSDFDLCGVLILLWTASTAILQPPIQHKV